MLCKICFWFVVKQSEIIRKKNIRILSVTLTFILKVNKVKHFLVMHLLKKMHRQQRMSTTDLPRLAQPSMELFLFRTVVLTDLANGYR